MPPKKIFDANTILYPLYREYPAGLSTGELSELLHVSRITGRIKLLELQKAGKIKETGTSNRHIDGEALNRNLKGRSNYNEWRLTLAQFNRMRNELFKTDYSDFLVKTLLGQPVEVHENVDMLALHGYVEYKRGKLKLSNKGVEEAVKILQERQKED